MSANTRNRWSRILLRVIGLWLAGAIVFGGLALQVFSVKLFYRLKREGAAARPRFHVHFTPTYASWLNQVEIWFNRITQQAIRRGTFSSVKDLVEKIDHYVQNSNRRAQPFVWTATADSIFAKVERLCERIYGTAH
jgi:putative transposase